MPNVYLAPSNGQTLPMLYLKVWREPKKADRVMDLVTDVLDGDPFAGLGKPEPLKYIAANIWSRRIDLEHRLVYQVDNNRVVFLQARYHYDLA